MKLLVSNVGSTSLKFKLFDMPEERVLCEAKIERVGSRDAAIMSYRSHLSGARFSAEGLCIPSYAEGIALFLEKLTGDETGVIKGVEEISAIGFKTVLSRGYYGVHELTDEVMENMREYLYIAPVHNAAYIEAIGQFKAVLPDVPMIGVFETAFHREIPLERALYSIPYEWYEKYGIRKMGYHGASHGYIAQQAAKLGRAERVISCHLGGSCSICAILDGKSVDNSFGFSLQTGVMHANRAGDIDPYIVSATTCARSAPRRRTGTHGQSWRSICSCAASCGLSARITRNWADLTSSSSPAGSARTPTLSEAECARRSGIWAWSWTRRKTAAAGKAPYPARLRRCGCP